MATPNIPPPPDWVFQRIIAVGGETGPRYEASLYGPVTCLLASYFPVADFFMIKPQGKIRPEFINDIDDTIRTSFNSYRATWHEQCTCSCILKEDCGNGMLRFDLDPHSC